MSLYVLEIKSPVEWNQLASILHSKGIKRLFNKPVDTSLTKVMCNSLSYCVVHKDFKHADEFQEVKLQDLYNLI